MGNRGSVLICIALVLHCLALPCRGADQSLHRRIDVLIEQGWGGEKPAGKADDAEFFRRVWLDLAGQIPPAAEVRKFLADTTPDKRAQAIDELLAAPSYVTRMQEAFHVILMERRGDHAQWQKFLQHAFENNLPWDQMVSAMLAPTPAQEDFQGAPFFLTKRLENYGQNPIDHPGLTRDIGRLFLGIDLQCAQCHNHLFVDDYKQIDFQGLLAITQTLKIGKTEPVPQVTEKPLAKKLEFVSVFDPTPREVGPRVPFGKEFEIPTEMPQDNSYSPLATLAQELPTVDNPQFARNLANRLWHLMLGRGLVEPLDTQHAANPPTHPELLDLLAKEVATHQFDIKWLLREIALSETYQRSSRIDRPTENLPRDRYLVALPKRLSPEQAVRSFVEATSSPDAKVQAATIEKLNARFVSALANPAREHEDHRHPSVQSALFLSNDSEVLACIARQPNNLLDRLLASNDDHDAADELYLSVFGRLPEEDERTELQSFLAMDSDRREQLWGHWIWAMLASTEFCVNH